jgi:hypothetical protein
MAVPDAGANETLAKARRDISVNVHFHAVYLR